MRDSNSADRITGFPVISIGFFFAGALSIALSVIVFFQDFRRLLEQLQTSAGAPIMTEKWLTTFFLPLAIGTGLVLFTIGFLALYWRHYVDQVTRQVVDMFERSKEAFLLEEPGFWGISRRNWMVWFLISCVVVLAQNWPSIIYGFFRYDDFEVLSLNSTKPLVELLFYPHADHTLPLFRLEISWMMMLFGVQSMPYFVALLLSFALTLFFTFLILRELQVERPAILLFMILYIGWTVWGGVTGGTVMLSCVTQTALFGSISMWAYLRWRESTRWVFSLICLFFMGLAVAVDIYGFWVPPAVLLFATCLSYANPPYPRVATLMRSHLWLLLGTAMVLLIGLLYTDYVFTAVTPGGFLSLLKNPYSISGIVQQFFYLITGGLLLSSFFPIGYWRLPASILVPILAVSLLLAFAVGIIVWKRMERSIRWVSVSVILIMLGAALETVLGRNLQGWAHDWTPHHVGIPYLWYCVLTAIAWSTIWRKIKIEYKPLMLQSTLVLILAFLGAQTIFGYVASTLHWYTFGYLSNIRDAQTRRANIEELRDKLIAPLLTTSVGQLRMPSLDGKYLFRQYPSLFIYNLSSYLDFIVPQGAKVSLLRNDAMQTGTAKVQRVSSLRSSVEPQFVQALQQDPYVQQLYLSDIELNSQRIECAGGILPLDSVHPSHVATIVRQEDSSWLFDDNGDGSFIVQSGTWDPETKHELHLGIQYLSNLTDKPRVEVIFGGDLKIPYNRNWVTLGNPDMNCLSIDLMQIYVYALNPHVKELQLRFPDSGRYRLLGWALQ